MKQILAVLVATALSASPGQTAGKPKHHARSATMGQERKPIEAADYTAERDFSGFELIGRHIRLPAERNLQTPWSDKRSVTP